MTPVEVDVFAAATWADEMPLRQAEFMSALIAGTGQGRACKRKLCALGKGSFRQQFKAGGERLRFHAGKQAQFALKFRDTADRRFRMRLIVVLHGLDGHVQ